MNSLIRILFLSSVFSKSSLVIIALSLLITGCSSASKKSYCDLVVEKKPAQDIKAEPEGKKKTK